MNAIGPFALLVRFAALLEELGIPYVLGGSMASSLVGEPRSTVDIDVAVRLDRPAGEALIEAVGEDMYVPVEAAMLAIEGHSSFNLIDTSSALKLDLFVLGDGLLDRMQIERRVHMEVPGAPDGIWVTSPEDQVLRKLDWFQRSGGTSDRQWRDVIGVFRVSGSVLDIGYMRSVAGDVGLADVLEEALSQAS